MLFLQSIWDYMNPIFCVCLEVAVTLLLTGAVIFVYNKVFSRLKSNSIYESDYLMYSVIENKFIKVVRYLNQTIVDNIKSDSGRLTEEEAEAIRVKAKEMIQGILTYKEVKTIIDRYGDYDKFVDLMIENTVVTEKLEKGE